ncbi:glycosyl hydrolase [Niabella drilacis]|uniref:glycosyl hydrolase n=1 Tax=Niabella drilacis (strain DSM 25811 / CCM 8410 / CCUG 62505 / LMG 26954 / E90) TaxID=1285928 RepID=UPI001C408CF7|nr:glycosyl hydrolase [Niabella drilacis]
MKVWIIANAISATAQVAPVVPRLQELNGRFDVHDRKLFENPSQGYHPETWFHFIGGNISKEGITADLEAIARAGISGIQLFHGQFGGKWPGVGPEIICLSPAWEDALNFTAQECKRLGLRFTLQNCPGWAMAGGPWIRPENAMRHLVWKRQDIEGAGGGPANIRLVKPDAVTESWRDYREVAVLAFPTPKDDTGEPLVPVSVRGNTNILWNDLFSGKGNKPVQLAPAPPSDPYKITVDFSTSVTIRSITLPSINSFNHGWCYEPGVTIRGYALSENGQQKEILNTVLPQSNWQDQSPVTLACRETQGVKKYRFEIVNRHDMRLGFIKLFSAARKNNWESEAGWTLRTIERSGDAYTRPPDAYVDPGKILDLTSLMDSNGLLNWKAPAGRWTILRIGHVNTGRKNGPAPPAGTGWECNKLSVKGAQAHFQGYIGRLAGNSGPVNGLLNGMLLDSWECETQTWTEDMEPEFERVASYPLRKWLPAVFGYVIKDEETTFRFLRDWRATINDLFTHQFYGQMSKLAKARNLSITYETAAGDVFPADIMEYYKYADVPMCEFWQPFTDGYVGSLNFKPVKPTVSAARLYGKPRVSAEAFTSFALTWNEQWQMLKEVANVNMIEGVTHLVFHTYTHNPQTNFRQPGTSFGAGIGTPFLRGQTWWKEMPAFTEYFARCNYLLERGKPVSDVLWYLGDEIDHKPDQNAPFPEGFKYDYCNTDVLWNRLTVKDGCITTPEGIRYRVLWLPASIRMLPKTAEKIAALIRAGATVVGDAPSGIATLSGGSVAQEQFNTIVNAIWSREAKRGVRKIGKGQIVSGMSLSDALKQLQMTPGVLGGPVQWVHRSAEDADWYFVCAPRGGTFAGTLSFRNTGSVEFWDPVSGGVLPLAAKKEGGRTVLTLDLPEAGAGFVVFHHKAAVKENKLPVPRQYPVSVTFTKPWTIHFPEGWGAPAAVEVQELKPWKELNLSNEGKTFSGTAVYTTAFRVDTVERNAKYTLDLGQVNMIASVSLNGVRFHTLWTTPYKLDITKAIRPGVNTLNVEVTSTWFNRLVYDAGLPEDQRKTWTINGPSATAALTNSGLSGPVRIQIEK